MAQDHPAAFLCALSKLNPVDQQLLIGYHILRTTQTTLGGVFGYNQSHCAKQFTGNPVKAIKGVAETAEPLVAGAAAKWATSPESVAKLMQPGAAPRNPLFALPPITLPLAGSPDQEKRSRDRRKPGQRDRHRSER